MVQLGMLRDYMGWSGEIYLRRQLKMEMEIEMEDGWQILDFIFMYNEVF